MAVFVTSLVAGLYFSIRASNNRRRPSKRWYVRTNPLNALLFEDELTPGALPYRTKAFRAFLIAIVSWIAAALVTWSN
ncbi:hypothetical protein [Bradyrhizobium sp. BR13661]|jgi:hypothetical protein|nr:hypothetical protein [Bradyrhizobium sp. BR13661]